MRIVVCVKQVPGSNEVRMDPETNTIVRDAKQAIINPFDSFAIEEAIRIKEQRGAEVTALSMGIPATEELLRDAVARGADRAVLLSDRAFAGADTLATSYTLFRGIEALGGADLILCGRMAVDGDTAQIGPELAEWLGIPHVTDVLEIESLSNVEVVVRQQTDVGVGRLRLPLPALLTVVKDINRPRMPSIAGVRRSLDAPFDLFDAKSLGTDPAQTGLNGSPTQVVATYVPQRVAAATPIKGDIQVQAAEILKIVGEVNARG